MVLFKMNAINHLSGFDSFLPYSIYFIMDLHKLLCLVGASFAARSKSISSSHRRIVYSDMWLNAKCF